MVSRREGRLLGVVLLLLMPATLLWAQTDAAAAKTGQSERATDPLGRDTPRGTLLGFMRAARDSNHEVAVQYLNTPLQGEAARELARQLFIVLDSRLPARLDEVSDRPEGRLANPLRPDQDIVGTIATPDHELEVIVERRNRGAAGSIWLFSQRTLEAVPDVYEAVNLISIERYLPGWLIRPRIEGIRVFVWLTLALIALMCYRLLGLLNPVVRSAFGWWRRRRGLDTSMPPPQLSGPIRLLVLAIFIRWVIDRTNLHLIERQLWSSIAILMTVGSVLWLLLGLNAYAERYIRRVFHPAGRVEVASLTRLARRFADVLVIAAAALVVVRRLGGDPTAALAGLGIGGIAVALAAQKTLENVVGGLSLIFDGAVRVGDFLKLGDALGTVDSIGLRSTRIRTLDRTILTVPNSQIASVNVETLSSRDVFWFHHFVGLRYETTPAQLRAVIKAITDLLCAEPEVDVASVRVRFLRFASSSLEFEIFAYIGARDWVHFLEIQQDLLLAVMEVVEEAGTAIALPAQTVHVAATHGLESAAREVPTASVTTRLAKPRS